MLSVIERSLPGAAPSPSLLLTAAETAAALRLAPSTVRRLLNDGAIRGIRVGAGPKARWRIPESELDRILTFDPEMETR